MALVFLLFYPIEKRNKHYTRPLYAIKGKTMRKIFLLFTFIHLSIYSQESAKIKFNNDLIFFGLSDYLKFDINSIGTIDTYLTFRTYDSKYNFDELVLNEDSKNLLFLVSDNGHIINVREDRGNYSKFKEKLKDLKLDSNGNISSVKFGYGDERLYKFSKIENNELNVKKYAKYGYDGFTKYKFDNKERIISEIRHNSSDKIIYTLIYNYNNENQIKSLKVFDKKQRIIEMNNYDYNNNIISQHLFKSYKYVRNRETNKIEKLLNKKNVINYTVDNNLNLLKNDKKPPYFYKKIEPQSLKNILSYTQMDKLLNLEYTRDGNPDYEKRKRLEQISESLVNLLELGLFSKYLSSDEMKLLYSFESQKKSIIINDIYEKVMSNLNKESYKLLEELTYKFKVDPYNPDDIKHYVSLIDNLFQSVNIVQIINQSFNEYRN